MGGICVHVAEMQQTTVMVFPFRTGKSPEIFLHLCCHIIFLGFLNARKTAFINIVDVSVRDNALTTFIKAYFFQHSKKPANFSFIETNCSLYE